MKIHGAKKIHYDSGPNMTPLVDIVMVILIFLMLTGTFAVQEHYLVSNLPLRRTGAGNVAQPPAGGFPEYQLLEIRVDQNATRDGYVARVGQIQTSDAKVLAEGLRRLRNNYVKVDPELDKVQVIISPGRAVKYDQIVEVYQAALDASFKKIGFATAR